MTTKPMTMIHMLSRFGLILAISLPLLSACSGINTIDTKGLSATALYEKAQTALNDENFTLAIEYYEKLETEHPFSAQTRQAQIDVIYAYYRANEPDSAIAAADRFIKLYPRHARVDYAYYLRALVNFNRTSGAIDRLLKRDPAVRDPHTAEQSFQHFAELIERFPNSPYADDAIQRMVHLRNYLARHEIYVARYYMKLKAYVAAANRAKYIIENYPQAPAVPEAMEILAKAYQRLELNDLAAQTRQVVKLNFPAGQPANKKNVATTQNPG
jgi:outer membrane protein assembly factor BamD